MNIRAVKRLQKAKRTHSTNTRVRMVAYRVSGFDEEREKFLAFSGVMKLTDSTLGALFRRHKELATVNKINLDICPM